MRSLAANPLLLTILALMKRQGVALPERRVELYQKYVETLLRTWNLVRGLGRPPEHQPDVVGTMRVMAPLALWMHQASPGVGLVKQADMGRQLVDIYAGRGSADPEQAARQFLADAREHAGLLLERGAGEYGFIHLTFQEYLAAVAIAQQGQRQLEPVVDTLAAHVGDDNWHEVTLLTIGYMGIIQQRDEAAGEVVRALVEHAPGEPGQAVVLAGQAVVDAWPEGVDVQSKETVRQALVQTLVADRQVKPVYRTAAADTLARLGDDRPGLGLHPDGLPDITWCEVPAGPFVMGSDKTRDKQAYDDEIPQRKVDLPTFRINRYPVTNAQYRAFVEDGGYTEQWRHCWTEAGWQWKGDRTGPDTYGGAFDLPNHPVVMVRWYEAVAFCRWLTVRLRQAGQLGPEEIVTLPSESQWEKAARGPDGQVYPWGDEPDPNRANYGDTGIGTTSAVGCFPGGASPYGGQDMSGNVWEWCRTRWQASYRDYQDDNDLEGKAPRVVRGGAFYDIQGYVRCAVRHGFVPDLRYDVAGFRVVWALSPSTSGL